MAKTVLRSPTLITSAGIMSHGIKVPAGNMVFVSGQVARNAQGEPVAARYGWRQEFFRARR